MEGNDADRLLMGDVKRNGAAGIAAGSVTDFGMKRRGGVAAPEFVEFAIDGDGKILEIGGNGQSREGNGVEERAGGGRRRGY